MTQARVAKVIYLHSSIANVTFNDFNFALLHPSTLGLVGDET